MNHPGAADFRRSAVEPIACLKGGWDLIKGQYWLFVGMSLVGILIGSFVPFNILLGPMMCGIYLALFRRQRDLQIEFGDLFKGFDFFAQSVVATLLHMAPIVMMLVPFYALLLMGPLLFPSEQKGFGPGGIAFIAVVVVFGIIMAMVGMFITIGFIFAYPLIVDRKLSGVDAVKLSLRAAMGNFWRLLGLLLLNAVVALAGLLLCYVGMFLVLPVTFAAIAVAYNQVFGLGDFQPELPPPPPVFAYGT